MIPLSTLIPPFNPHFSLIGEEPSVTVLSQEKFLLCGPCKTFSKTKHFLHNVISITARIAHLAKRLFIMSCPVGLLQPHLFRSILVNNIAGWLLAICTACFFLTFFLRLKLHAMQRDDYDSYLKAEIVSYSLIDRPVLAMEFAKHLQSQNTRDAVLKCLIPLYDTYLIKKIRVNLGNSYRAMQFAYRIQSEPKRDRMIQILKDFYLANRIQKCLDTDSAQSSLEAYDLILLIPSLDLRDAFLINLAWKLFHKGRISENNQ